MSFFPQSLKFRPLLLLLFAILYLSRLLFIINSFKDTPVYSTYFYSHVFNNKGPQTYYSFITVAPTPFAVPGDIAKKYLQDIHEQELKDYK